MNYYNKKTGVRESLQTVSGYDFSEVASAFQKSIRRGLEEDALFWGIELYKSNFYEYAWKRMKIICSEDVGLAEPNGPAIIHSLYSMFNEQKKKEDVKHAPERLFFVHAILWLARAKKSRVVDHALIYHFEKHAQLKRQVLDWALDKHTVKGRMKGRGWQHFFDEGIKLENKAEVDGEQEYCEKARAAIMKEQTIDMFEKLS